MKKLVLILVAIVSIALMSSCSDDKSTTPGETPGEGFPLATGNMWEYETYEADENGNKTGSVTGTNTITIGSKTTIAGKECYELIEDGETSYVYSDETGFYSYAPEDEEEDEEEGPVFSGWFKIIDFKNTNWEIFSTTINEVDEESSTVGTINVVGKQVSVGKVNYKNKSYDTKLIQNIFNTDLTITVSFEGEEPIIQRYVRSDTTLNTFIPGLGMYSITETDYDVTGTVPSKSIDILINHQLK